MKGSILYGIKKLAKPFIKYKDVAFWDNKWGKANYAKTSDENLHNDNFLLDEQVRLFKSLNSESVFDYGGGDGHSLKRHIDAGYLKDYGYGEISQSAIDLARKILPGDCKIYDLRRDEISGQYDMVYTRAVIVAVSPNAIEKVYNDILRVSKNYVFMQEAYYYPDPVGRNFNHRPWEFFTRNGFEIIWMKYQIIIRRDGTIRHPGQGYDLLLRKIGEAN